MMKMLSETNDKEKLDDKEMRDLKTEKWFIFLFIYVVYHN